VGQLEKIYKAYKPKIEKNEKLAKDNPSLFAKRLNDEYNKLIKSKAKNYARLDKLPVRIYGSGDFKPHHLHFLKQLKFKFYIISKNITQRHMTMFIDPLLKLENLTKIVLSFDNQNMNTYSHVRDYLNKDKIGFAYTGMADDFNLIKTQGYKFTIFFNISNKKVEKEKSRRIKEQCPCDSGLLAHDKSCSFCNKCWRSSVTKQRDWNYNYAKN